MRAYVVKEWIHPSKLSLTLDAPDPQPGPEDVLVDIFSAALNFFDILQVQGKYQVKPPFPFVMGTEFAGKIASNSPIPRGCSFKPGDRVFGSAQGCFAEKVAVQWEHVHLLPDNLTFDQSAGLFLTWPTSYEALVGRADLKPGEWVLVTAAAGGVGIAAVQLAKALGGNVIAAAGSAGKLEICKKYGGADYTVDYTKPNWQKEVLKITGGKGVDVVYDPVGRIVDSLKCIAWKGRALVIGFAGGNIEKLPLNLVLLKNITIMGLHWGAYTTKEPSRVPVVWKALMDLFATGRAKPVIYDKIYTLENVMDGMRALETRETWGKSIVRIRTEDNKKVIAKL
ncbi:hypothetical protein SERLA73DRAFT_179859 [Serpula lacrymans var. lacrymans S7.3]|uniref:Enoyl reductase (ER) domain-containing protein n=2 Tax=Serpula lacrymans var. lacrymans TaxID=341189 RepID=F8PUU8_SERL3|nr:uncharacterized protein SERLADRAFT_465160 [Serpula lacrymans var. lacrymans S7.9]EGN99712.1 hypothetical protein SERLA73DRAFT_179859 [Serpula lacrymans var. lacrymans S7.3]EGO25277.1 hypothetical protein SERLADRAFT_465160 [Serpula lacrymans var. lacrymans S7.9]